jgi:peptide/nickel transport system substrate-binding protein
MNTKNGSLLKLVVLLILASVVLSLAGCQPAAPAATPAPAPKAAEATKAPAAAAPAAAPAAPAAAAPAAPAATAAPAAAAPKAAAPKRLVVAAAKQYGDSLDVFKASTTMQVHTMIYEPLVSLDTDYKFQPGLADSWETSADGTKWTFHLKKGVKFHDGTPFTAEVVKWWIEGMQKGVNSYMFETATDIKAVDANTLEITFKGPFPNLLYNLSTSFSGIMSKAAYEKAGADYGTKVVVGTGPFMFKEWVPNDHILLVKNPDYNWAAAWTKHTGPANVDEILVRFIPEDATRLVELQSGGVQLLLDPPPAREVAALKKDSKYFVKEFSDQTIQFIGFNVNDPILKDVRTRKAIGYSLDRKLITETIYQGQGRAAASYLCAELGGSVGMEAYAPNFDLAKSKAMLAEVGWKPGSDGVLVADTVEGVAKGTKFEVKYWTYQEDEFKRLAEVTQKMLSDIGIKVTTIPMDSPTYTAQLKAGGAQLILRQYGWDNNDILEWFHHSKYLPYPNYLGVKDTKLDAMLDDANFKTASSEERDTKYVALQKYLIDTWYPWAPFRQNAQVLIGSVNVKDFFPVPLRGTSATTVWSRVDLVK